MRCIANRLSIIAFSLSLEGNRAPLSNPSVAVGVRPAGEGERVSQRAAARVGPLRKDRRSSRSFFARYPASVMPMPSQSARVFVRHSSLAVATGAFPRRLSTHFQSHFDTGLVSALPVRPLLLTPGRPAQCHILPSGDGDKRSCFPAYVRPYRFHP